MYIVENAPLQLYISGLAFAPRNNVVRRAFKHQIPKWLTVTPSQSKKWDPRHLVLDGHQFHVTRCAFSADSSLIASSSIDKTVRLWSSRSGKCLRIFDHRDAVTNIVFSPGSKIMATSEPRGVVLVRDLVTGQEIKKIDTRQRIDSFVFSPDATLLAIGSAGVQLWRTDTWELEQKLDTYPTLEMIFSSDSSLLVLQTNSSVLVWDIATWTCTERYDVSHIRLLTTLFLGNGSILGAHAVEDCKSIEIFSFTSGEVIKTLKTHISDMATLAFTKDLTLAASSCQRGSLHLWDLNTESHFELLEPDSILHSERLVTFVAFSPDKSLLVSLSVEDGPAISLWKMHSLRELPYSELESKVGCFTKSDKSSSVPTIAVSPSSKYIAWISRSGRLRLCYQDCHGRNRNFCGNKSYHRNHLQFSPDSAMLLLTKRIDMLHLLRIDRPCRLGTFKVNPDSNGLFSPDSRYVATTRDPFVSLWNTRNGNLKWRLRISSTVDQLVFSPDGAILASASEAAVRLWRVETGQCIMDLGVTLPAFRNGYSLSFATDSNYLVATSTDSEKFGPYSDVEMLSSTDTSDITDRVEEAYIFEEKMSESSGHEGDMVSDQTFELNPNDQSEFKELICVKPDLCAWRIDTGERVMLLADPSARVTVISPDMSLVATQHRSGWITILRGGNVVQIIDGHRDVLCRFDKGASQIIVQCWDIYFILAYFPILQDSNIVEEKDYLANLIHVGYGITPTKDWVLRNGCKVLWIPRAYRHMTSIAVEENILVAGYSSGHVLILRWPGAF